MDMNEILASFFERRLRDPKNQLKAVFVFNDAGDVSAATELPPDFAFDNMSVAKELHAMYRTVPPLLKDHRIFLRFQRHYILCKPFKLGYLVLVAEEDEPDKRKRLKAYVADWEGRVHNLVRALENPPTPNKDKK